jgi:ankyrin repeat protein
MHAAQAGHKEVAEVLLSKGADINQVDHSGRTALIYAAQFRQKDIVELLVEKGADLEVRDDNDGATALEWAQADAVHLSISDDGREEIVALLERAEAALQKRLGNETQQKESGISNDKIQRLKEKRPPKPSFKKPQP